MELATHTPFVPQGVPPLSKSFDLIGPKVRRSLAKKLIHQPEKLVGV